MRRGARPAAGRLAVRLLLPPPSACLRQDRRARPPQLDAIIATLPPDATLAARITWGTMSEARRADALFVAPIAAGRATEQEVAELFQGAAKL